MPSAPPRDLLFLVDSAYDRRSWHGTNLRGSLRGVTPRLAAWRPGPGRHNIWELAVHAAYWKYAVWRRLTGAKRGSFPLEGSDWFPRPDAGSAPTVRAWRQDLALLDRMHHQLRAAAAALRPRELETMSGTVTRRALVAGVAAHDLYHAGQVQLIKRLATARR